MLKFNRRAGESFVFDVAGESVSMRVERLTANRVTFSFEASQAVRILREEVSQRTVLSAADAELLGTALRYMGQRGEDLLAKLQARNLLSEDPR